MKSANFRNLPGLYYASHDRRRDRIISTSISNRCQRRSTIRMGSEYDRLLIATINLHRVESSDGSFNNGIVGCCTVTTVREGVASWCLSCCRGEKMLQQNKQSNIMHLCNTLRRRLESSSQPKTCGWKSFVKSKYLQCAIVEGQWPLERRQNASLLRSTMFGERC